MINEFITKRLITLRENSGFTLEELCQKMNKPCSYWRVVERGEFCPTIREIEMFCEVINISFFSFFKK